MAEQPTFANADTDKLGGGAAELQNKVFGFDGSKSGVECDDKGVMDAKALDEFQLEIQRRQKFGNLVWPQNSCGVGIESEGNRNASDERCRINGCPQHCLMAEMQTIKDACCQNDRRIDFRKGFDGTEDFHQAPRSRETAGRLRTRCAIASIGPALSSSMVTAPSTLKRPDFVRRSDLRCAPLPSSKPMSLA